MYHGDIRLGDTIDIKFTTRQVSGAPTTLAGSPVISAYPGNSTTELTAGITLSVDFDSRTGLHNVRVVATSGNGYATATNYVLVITTGTVNSVSVVGECVGSFSIEARSAVMPTTAARTLDVSAGGEAGVDWANVGSPTTAVDLSGTTIKTTQKVDVDTIKTNPVVNGGTITFPTTATLASTTNITAGTVTTATNVTTVNGLAANIITAASIAAAALNGKGDWNIGKTGYALSAAGVQAIWDALTAALTTANSIGKLIVDNLNATLSSRATQASVDAVQADADDIQTRLPAALTAGGHMKADALALSGDTAAADNAEAFFDGTGYAGTNNIIPTVTTLTNGVSVAPGGITSPSFGAGAIDSAAIAPDAIGASELAASAATEIADAMLTRDMSAVTGEAARSPLNAFRRLRNRVGVAGGTGTVYKEDDATTAWTAAVTTAAGNPVSEVDPA